MPLLLRYAANFFLFFYIITYFYYKIKREYEPEYAKSAAGKV